MKQLSLFDLPAGPAPDPDAPSLWWPVKYKPLYDRARADFNNLYQVAPIFHLVWPRHQVFLTDPGQALVIEIITGLLSPRAGKRLLWEVDYRGVRAFRPQDVSPRITDTLAGTMSREAWRPLIMTEIKVPVDKVERFLDHLGALDVFWQHWPAFQDSHLFRVFGAPDLLESLRYAVFPGTSAP